MNRRLATPSCSLRSGPFAQVSTGNRQISVEKCRRGDYLSEQFVRPIELGVFRVYGHLERREFSVPMSLSLKRTSLCVQLVPNKSRLMPNIEHRQMKICSTCFDVTVSLLRTIEMTISVAPTVMLDKHSSKSEMLLFRLLQVRKSSFSSAQSTIRSFSSQLVSQIINRLATRSHVLEEVERLKMFGRKRRESR